MTASTFKEKSRLPLGRYLIGLSVLVIVPSGWWGVVTYLDHWKLQRHFELKATCDRLTGEGQWTELESVARKWTEWDPRTDDGWLFLADARLQQGDILAAQEFLQKVPDSSRKAIPALLLASEFQLGLANRPLDVPGTLQRVLRIAPSSMTAQRRLIFFYAMTLQRAQLLRQIREAIASQGEPVEAYVYLVLSSQLSFSNGTEMTSRWLQSDPENEVLMVARALNFADTMDHVADAQSEPESEKQARYQNLVKLLNRFPENPALLRYFLQRKMLEFDVESVGRMLDEIPVTKDDSLFWRYRGWYHAQRNELEMAEKAYRKSRDLDRLDWHTWFELAGVLRRMGKLDEAEEMLTTSVVGKELQKALRQMPDVASATPEMLLRIVDYASLCGDIRLAQALSARLQQMAASPGRPELPGGNANALPVQ